MSGRLPPDFSGFRIAQVSDLRNAEFGEGNCKLIDLLTQTDPDIIVLTGDLIDLRISESWLWMPAMSLSIPASSRSATSSFTLAA